MIDDGFRLKWTLATKVGGLAVALLLLLAIAGYNYRAFTRVGDEIAEITQADLPMTKRITQLHANQLQQHIALERLLRVSPAAAGQARADFEALSRQFDAEIAKSIQ